MRRIGGAAAPGSLRRSLEALFLGRHRFSGSKLLELSFAGEVGTTAISVSSFGASFCHSGSFVGGEGDDLADKGQEAKCREVLPRRASQLCGLPFSLPESTSSRVSFPLLLHPSLPSRVTKAQQQQRQRGFATAASSSEKPDVEKISVTFVNKDGEEKEIQVPVGMSMLEAAHENDIELEGACEGSLACSTCHVIITDDDYYGKLPEPSDEENDMLDLAFGLTETSRLGCQVIAKPELDGLRMALPAATRNFAVDGHVPKPH